MFSDNTNYIETNVSTDLFDLWEDNIAILSLDGMIVYTNPSWKNFAQENNLDPAECSEGTNYLQICDEATGDNSDEAPVVSKGIRDVIQGNKSIYKIEYPCHSPDEKRWFLLKVTLLSKTYPTNVFLQHINITERKEAELSSKETQNQLKQAQSIGNMGSWQFNFSTGKIPLSEEAYKIYGLDIAKVYTIKEVQKIPLSEYRPMLDGALNKLVSGESNYDVEFKIQRPNDGCIRDIHSVAEYDSQKNTVTGIIQDITAQKKHEQKIKLFKTIFDKANYGNVITDFDGNFKYINDCFAKIHGFEPEELIGQNLSIFHNEEQMTDVSSINKSLLEDGYYTNVEVWHTHRNGTTFPMLMTGIVIEDEQNNPLFLSATAIDITEMKDKEYKLRESEAKFRSYIDNAPTGVFVADENGNYAEVNQAACDITGYSREELLSKNLIDLISPDDREKAIKSFESVNRTGYTNEDVHFVKKDGNRRIWNVNAVKLSDTRFLGFVRDITDRKKLENALLESKLVAEEASKTKSEFLANMSHELRTPLNSIIGFSQVLSDEKFGDLNERQSKYIFNVLKGGQHLLELVNNILDISKVESGNMDYNPEVLNVPDTIEDTIVLVQSMAKKKSIEMKHSLEPENLEMQIDRMKFKEIMYNLLSNAIKFTPQKGEVEVTSKVVDNKVQIDVSDTGIGIPEEKYEEIFDPFTQADFSSTRKFGGTGLGLALVKKYVEMHGGDITLKSEVGVGSTFTITIPIT